MNHALRLTLLLVLAGTPACGDGSHAPAEPHESEEKPVTSAEEDDWETLVTGQWSLPAGEEGYVCVRKTIEADVYVSSFEAINPPGTHHTVLTVGSPSGPDGVEDCRAGTNHTDMIFGSGVGTNRLDLPKGVSTKIPAGSQVLLNLHLFNATTEELSGVSGTRVRPANASNVEHLAEQILAGPISLDIPPRQQSVNRGTCTMSGDVTIFRVAPHMHQLGVHMKVVAEASNGETLLHEGPYTFEQQIYYPVDLLQLSEGDRIRVECTYQNDTDKTVTFGDSTLQEMCFAGIYRYPALEGNFICTDLF